MYSLTHTNYEKLPQYYKYLITFTLPKCHYKKTALKQKEAMSRRIKELANLIDIYSAHGCYEFTLKGNLHVHMIANIIIDKDLSDTTRVKIAASRLKTRGIHDIQLIKNYEKASGYLLKDTKETSDVFKNCGATTVGTLSPQFILHKNTDLSITEYEQSLSYVHKETPSNLIKSLDIVQTEKVECNCDCLDDIQITIN